MNSLVNQVLTNSKTPATDLLLACAEGVITYEQAHEAYCNHAGCVQFYSLWCFAEHEKET